MQNSQDVVNTDVDYICRKLESEFTQMSGKRLLITGGAGFLGHYFVLSVLHWNKAFSPDKVIDLTIHDNFSRGYPDWLEAVKDDPTLTIVTHDVCNPLPDGMPDYQYIIHGASIASPTYYRIHPIQTMDANVDGLRYLLEYCRESHEDSARESVEGFLFFSTSEIYGDPQPENIPTPETYRGNVSCTGPRACYDESKRYGETLCVNFAQQYSLPIKTARPFNNYGPGLKITDRRALPDFARDVLNGEDIVLLSDGAPTRTFCYVADAVIGYYKILVRGEPGEAYNIGMDKPEISIAELADRVVAEAKNLFDYDGKVVRKVSDDKDYLVDNPNRRCPIIDKARNGLDYNPEIDLDEGMRRSLLWYSGNREAEDS
ncbi:MAG: NAD-dependent epimerase/dehydratase family protein [Pseudomonadota bacterium]